MPAIGLVAFACALIVAALTPSEALAPSASLAPRGAEAPPDRSPASDRPLSPSGPAYWASTPDPIPPTAGGDAAQMPAIALGTRPESGALSYLCDWPAR